MTRRRVRRKLRRVRVKSIWALALVAATGIAGCSSEAGHAPVANGLPALLGPATKATAATPIQHVVIVIQENRTFDNFFATFPGADGATTGTTHTGKVIPLVKAGLVSSEIEHTYQTFRTEYDKGKMDGFDLAAFGHGGVGGPAGTYPYRYVDPAQIAPYWAMARRYVLADHAFQTQGSGSFTAHQDLIAGGTAINATQSLVDYPSNQPWGCRSEE